MAYIWENSISILAENLNSGLSYLKATVTNQKQFEKMHLFYHYCHGNFEHVKFLALCWQIAIVGGLIWGHKLLKSKSLVVVKLYFQIKFPTPYFHEILDWSILKVRQSRHDFFKPMYLPKNERMNSTLLQWNLRSTCFRSCFWKKLRTPKRHFEINWPLHT